MCLLTSPDHSCTLNPLTGNCTRDRRERKIGGKCQDVPLLINILHKRDKVVVAAEGNREQDPLASVHARYLSILDTREHVETEDFDNYKMYK